MNKKVRDEEKMQKKMLSAGKHDIKRAIRDYIDSQRDVVLTKQAFQKDWLGTFAFFTMMNHLKFMFKEKKKAFKKRQEIFLRFQIFLIRYKRALKKRGEFLRDRMIFDIRGYTKFMTTRLLTL